ncbi:MAG: T9SS type A sorting domain-containing protein [Saprospiraceae bacterium]
MKYFYSIAFWICMFFCQNIFGQGWEKFYDFEDNDYGLEIFNNSIGGFTVISNTLQYRDENFLQLDSDGKIIKQVRFKPPVGSSSFAFTAMDTIGNGDFIVTGTIIYSVFDKQRIFLMKINSSGQIQWFHDYGGVVDYRSNSVARTLDGGFVITGYKHLYPLSSGLLILKTDSQGSLEWDHEYRGPKYVQGNDVIQTSDGGYAVIGTNGNGYYGNPDIYLLKTDANGDTLWTKKYGDATPDFGNSIIEIANKNLVFCGAAFWLDNTDSYSDATVVQTDSMGKIIWAHGYENADNSSAISIKKTIDGHFILSGSVNDPLTTGYKGYLLKIDQEGKFIWSKAYSGGELDIFNSVIPTPDSGYAAIGYRRVLPTKTTDLYIIKTDSLGQVLSSYVSGHIFWDKNHDCIFQPGESGTDHFIIKASGSHDIYGTSDSEGNFFIRLDTGSYVLQVFSPNQYWESCTPPATVSLNPNDTVHLEFAMQETVNCPFLTISVSTPFLRRCFPGRYYVHYCNSGTSTATNVMIYIKMDSFLLVNASSIPFSISNNEYVFQVDDLTPGQCGSFSINYTLSCEAELGTIHCVDASIQPDTQCILTVHSQAHSKECQTIRGSFDPNDKRAFVNGLEEATVSPDSTIEYQLRFQNTGTDTAFRITIMDTLPEQLDLFSFQPGASSHPYTYEIVGERILKFTFDQIMLPDSFINEPGSHGFVKFYIQQHQNLPLGTFINNDAAIFFDYNNQVVTPTSSLQVEKVIVSTKGVSGEVGLKFYPNPVYELLNISIPGHEEHIYFKIMDNNGKLMKSSSANGPNLEIPFNEFIPGVYFIQIFSNMDYMGTIKFIHI